MSMCKYIVKVIISPAADIKKGETAIAVSPFSLSKKSSKMNCTLFVRQYDILFSKWGDFYAKRSTKQTIYAGIQKTGD